MSSTAQNSRWRFPTWLLFGLLALTFLVPVALLAHQGTLSRFISDDFCTAWTLGEKGFVQSQIYWYTNWSGRYSFTLVVNMIQALGSGIVQAVPGITLLAWIAGFSVMFREVARAMTLDLKPVLTVLIASLAVFVIAIGAPNRFQSLYWLTGISTYTIPLILMAFYSSWLSIRTHSPVTRKSTGAELLISGLAAFLLGGFSETYVSLQASILLIAFLVTLRDRTNPRINRLNRLLLSGLVGSAASILIILLSPGTRIRSGLISDPAGIAVILQRSLVDLKIFLSLAWKSQLPQLLVCGLLPALVVLSDRQGESLRMDLSRAGAWKVVLFAISPPLIMLLFMLATIAPYEYAVSTYPDARVLITTQTMMVIGILCWSLVLGRLASGVLQERSLPVRSWVLAAMTLILSGSVFLSWNSAQEILSDRDDMQYFAESWDRRDAFLKNASKIGLDSVAAASLNHMGGLDEIGYDPDEWINRCVAQYYELKSVIAK